MDVYNSISSIGRLLWERQEDKIRNEGLLIRARIIKKNKQLRVGAVPWTLYYIVNGL